MTTTTATRLKKKPTRKTVNVKVMEPIYKHLEEFRASHGWSVNETILQAINLMVVIRHYDREDQKIGEQQVKAPVRQTGRLFYEGRTGDRKDIAGEIMISMGKALGSSGNQ